MSRKKSPGPFGKFVMAVMAKKGIRSTDIFTLSGGKIRQGRITEITYGHVPDVLGFVDLLADILKENRHTLRLLVASEKLDEVCKTWKVKRDEVCTKESTGETLIPLFPLESLHDYLTDRGIPKSRKSHQMVRKEIYNPHAFAVRISKDVSNPRLEIGDICVIAPGSRILDDHLGILGTAKKIYVGMLKIKGNLCTVTTLFPFKSISFAKKDVRFAYPVVDIILDTGSYLIEP